MKKDFKNLGQILNRKELKNDELKNFIGGKGYICGGFNCYQACAMPNGDKKCATYDAFYGHFFPAWGCRGGNPQEPCWCDPPFDAGKSGQSRGPCK